MLGITYYNYGKKGYFKRNYRSKKEQQLVPRKEATTINQAIVGRKVRIQEVAVASYIQDNLEYNINRTNNQELALTDLDQERLARSNQYTRGPSNTLIETNDEGEIIPLRFA